MTTYTLDVTERTDTDKILESLIFELFNSITIYGFLPSFEDGSISFNSICTLVRSRFVKLGIDIEKNRKMLEHVVSILYKIAINYGGRRI